MSKKNPYEALLSDFRKYNEMAKISGDGDLVRIEEIWPGTGYIIQTQIDNKGAIKNLNQVCFHPQFDAFIFPKKKTIEFIYGFLDKDREVDWEKFEIHINGEHLKCEFSEPSKEFWSICQNMVYTPEASIIHVAQLMPFIDIKTRDISEAPKLVKDYFENKEPISFKVKLKKDPLKTDLPLLARHINFILSYYDRNSPSIVIRESSSQIQNGKNEWNPLVKIEDPPNKISLSIIDDHILKLLQIASESNTRHAFAYYYQVFEYAGFYYVEDKVRNKILNILQDPSMINCHDDKISNLLTTLVDLNHNDDVKMRNVIQDKVNPDLIWKEIERNKSLYVQEINFEGGFQLSPLLSEQDTIETWRTSFMPKTFSHLTKIRNCLVHARERRESRVILPTRSNNKLLLRYIPIIRRMAEEIAIRTNT